MSQKLQTWATKAALLASTPGSLDGDFIASQDLGSPVNIEVRLVVATTFGQEGLSFTMLFPYGSAEAVEDNGFGVCHRFGNDSHRPVPSGDLLIRVQFQREGLKISARVIEDNIPGRKNPLPEALSSQQALTLVEIQSSGLSVYNFGMPFCNPGHASEDWLIRNEPIVGNMTLMQILKQRSFRFVVPATVDSVWQHLDPNRIPPPTESRHGTVHSFDMNRYAKDAPEWAGHHYPPCLTFRNDNEHEATISQSVVQDFWWLHCAREHIAQSVIPVYFVPREQDSDQAYYVVVPVPEGLKLTHYDAWRRFMKQGFLKVRLFEYREQVCDEVDSDGQALPIPEWSATIVESPDRVDVLRENGHLAHNPKSLVLCVFRPATDRKNAKPDFVLTQFNTLEGAEQSDPEH